ncbi:MAG: bifunctional isocitrate dehydrogenase kinase/phosphatase [Desulfococcaceae bacterium]
MPDSPARIAENIRDAFEEHQKRFGEITRRARDRFNRCQWRDLHKDGVERLDIYANLVSQTVKQIGELLGERARDAPRWVKVRSEYADQLAGRDDAELAETFFNSVVRRIFETVGVNPAIEFTEEDFRIPVIEDRACPVCSLFGPARHSSDVRVAVQEILKTYKDRFEFQNMERDVDRIADALGHHLREVEGVRRVDGVEMIESVFYRGTVAFLIGRIRCGARLLPLAIAFLNEGAGVFADAVLLTQSEVSILFSFTRSYFHVEVDRPAEMVNFLKTIIPLKRVSEIYTSIGLHKHGKAELYRELSRHLEKSTDRFEIARGKRGMVMLVFTLPSFEVVFKVIRDQFDYPKQTSRSDVEDRYDLVFRHDRAGRLVDAQEFSDLQFRRDRFDPDLLEELRKKARATVEVGPETVVIHHLYTERRLKPLDLFVSQADGASARDAVVDYGRAIKELAASNIFPGDLFTKNFGVTRHGRVVFYDYDELTLLTDCNFRKMPRSRGYDEEMASEPWFFVDEHDVFPEEFRTFLGFPEDLQAVFEANHGDLFTPAFWNGIQDRIRAGEVIDILPYKPHRRLSNARTPVVPTANAHRA